MADVTKEYLNAQNGGSTPSVDFGGINCLAFAGNDYANANLITPLNYDVLAPWVKVSLSKDGNTIDESYITVGNKSSDMLHAVGDTTGGHPHAAVTSFECGLSNGNEAKIEIVDEMGGSFTTFFQRGLIKTLDNVSAASVVNVQFGWMGVGCDGRTIKYPVEPWTLHFLLMNIDVSMGDGKIKFVLNCVDMMYVSMVKSTTTKYENKTLKQAIIEYLDSEEPKMDVAFLRKSENGGPPQEWNFPAASNRPADDNGDGGAEGEGHLDNWEVKNDTKLAVINNWLSEFLTENKKGHTITSDPMRTKPTVIIWEGLEETEVIKKTEGGFSKGTFLVNGGKCSNVISFNPNINFIAAFFMAQNSGNTGNLTLQQSNKAPSGQPNSIDGKESTEEVGQQVATPATNTGVNAHGKDQGKVAGEAAAAQAKANAWAELPQPIQAELKIIGNPTREFVDIKLLRSSYVSIIFINPFTIERNTSELSDDNLCGDWLCRPQINRTLTNRFWLIRGVTHSIRDGKYTTTLNLYLIGPGITAPAGSNIGGDGLAPIAANGDGGTGP